VFEILRESVLPDLFERARPEGQLRVWVAGCSTAEDAPSVRRLVTLVLLAEDFEVIDVNDPTETLRISREHDGPIDLVLSEIVMPGISGLSGASQVTAERPETRVLYVSGYAAETFGANDILRPGENLLPKPCTPQALVQAVQRILQSPAPSTDGELDPPDQDG
jgi:two-component system, cell cycle sensor histidine kinase and response regulator CckA